MKTDDFDYYLPEELIAQTPLKKRDSSRMLVLDKQNGNIFHKTFSDIIDYLNPGDTLVLNDTKVIPARIIGVKEETGAVIELLLLKNIDDNNWECLTRPAKRVKVGTVISFGDGMLKATCSSVGEEGIRVFSLSYDGILYEILDKLGTMPLPPYIHEKLENQSRYQTVYAKNPGSAAAPTAGLHFTNELLDEIRKKGINPTAEVIGNLTKSRHVGILATEGTIKSESYKMEIGKLWPDIQVSGVACPLWAAIVEANEADSPGADYFVKKRIDQLMRKDSDIDTVILGCTHYPLLMNSIVKNVPDGVRIVPQGQYVANSLHEYLNRHPELERNITQNGTCQYLTTESEEKFKESAQIFLHERVNVTHVDLE